MGSSCAEPLSGWLFLVRRGFIEVQIVREERHQLGFDAIGDVIEMVSLVDLEEVGDFIGIQDLIKILGGIGDAMVLVPYIQSESF